MTIGVPVCWTCKNYAQDSPDPVCRAFPDGIPEQIYLGNVPHKKPYPGDNGIRYEEIKD